MAGIQKDTHVGPFWVMVLDLALKRNSCHEILGCISQHTHTSGSYLPTTEHQYLPPLNSHGLTRLTHVFPKVLNLNCLSRAVPSLANVQRPPSEASRALSAGVTLAASVPAENRGWAMVDAKRNSDGMRAEGWKGRMVGRNQ